MVFQTAILRSQQAQMSTRSSLSSPSHFLVEAFTSEGSCLVLSPFVKVRILGYALLHWTMMQLLSERVFTTLGSAGISAHALSWVTPTRNCPVEQSIMGRTTVSAGMRPGWRFAPAAATTRVRVNNCPGHCVLFRGINVSFPGSGPHIPKVWNSEVAWPV